MRRFASVSFALLLAGCRTKATPPSPHKHPPPVSPPSAVRLVCINFERSPTVEASGFFVSADGLLVTCAHVISNAMPLGVALPDGTNAGVSYLVAADPESDLVLLRIDGTGFRALPLADGPISPHGPFAAVTKDGIAAATYVGPHHDPDVGATHLFSAPALGVGASGGAIVDVDGRVVAVIRGPGEENPAECVAVPVDRLRALLAKAKTEPRAPRPGRE